MLRGSIVIDKLRHNGKFLYYSEDHAIGLATFTIMAGLGGSLGYAMGGINWGPLGKMEWRRGTVLMKYFQGRFLVVT